MVVNVPGLDEAVEVYARLLGIEARQMIREGGQAVLPLASGRVILEEGGPSGVGGVILRVASLAETAKVAGPLEGSPVAWLAPAAAHGLRFGFVEGTPPG